MAIDTPKLHLLLIQENWKFADDSFNAVIEDMDNKLIGIAHADSKVHWDKWNTGYSYVQGDIVRVESCKSNQYYLCVTNGISGTTEPTNDITGSIVNDGTAQWKVCIIGDSEASASVDIFRGGLSYTKGQLVLYNEVLYRCKVAHVAAATMELDEDKWQQVDASLQPWKTATYFLVNDLVVYNDVIYKCTTAHTSGYTFDYTKWIPLTITLIEDWAVNTEYIANQIVLYNGEMYRALDSHTSDSSDFATDLAVPHWEYITNSLPEWIANEGYLVGQVVLYDNRLYKCNTAHTATSTFDPTKWTPILASPVIEEWQVNTNYLAGQLVLNSGMLLKAIDNHISDASDIINDMDIPNNNNHWELVYANIAPWQASTVYEIGSQVIYDNCMYEAIDTHTSGVNFDISHWELIGQFNAFMYDWQANKYYYANQVVVVDKEIYRCDTSHTSAVDWATDSSNWTKISAATIIEPWASSTEYLVNQVVTINGILYRCNTAHTSGLSFDDTKFTPLYANIVNWESSTDYRVGELVIYDNQIYKCLIAHTSQGTFEVDGAKWQTIANNIASIPIWASGVYYYTNQVVKYNGKIWRCLIAHTSGAEDKPDFLKIYSNSGTFFHYDQSNMTSVPNDYIVDLGSNYYIDRIYFKASAGYMSLDYTISSSIDGITYTNHSSGNLSYEVYFDSYFYARYIKITATQVYLAPTSSSGSIDAKNLQIFGDSNKWEVIIDQGIKITYWAQNTRYKKDEIVIYDDEFYKCINTNFSGTTFNPSDWKKIPRMIIPDWKSDEDYILNQVVFYDGKLYKCTTAHTSSSTFTQANWTPVNDTVENWAIDKYYYINQVVWYNNSLWRCLTAHTSVASEAPDGNAIYISTTNIAQVTNTSTIPYSETIDLGASYIVNDITYNKNETDMTADYNIKVSTDNITFVDFYENSSVRYIKVTAESVNINAGATSPVAYLDNFVVTGQSNKWQEISTMNTLTSADIAEMFI